MPTDISKVGATCQIKKKTVGLWVGIVIKSYKKIINLYFKI